MSTSAPLTNPGTAPAVVFIDSRVPHTPELLAGLSPQAVVVTLDAQGDGLAQMAAYLSEHPGAGAVHVLAHGWQGQLWLGKHFLDAQGLTQSVGTLSQIGQALSPDADILVYACNLAQGDAGAAFVNTLAALTGADVAASDNRTGAGGDWALEVSTGQIEAGSPFDAQALAATDVSLATVTVTSNADTGAGSLRQAITDAIAGDTITFNAGMTVTLSSGQLAIAKNLTIDGDLDNNGTPDVTIDVEHHQRRSHPGRLGGAARPAGRQWGPRSSCSGSARCGHQQRGHLDDCEQLHHGQCGHRRWRWQHRWHERRRWRRRRQRIRWRRWG